MLTFKRATIIAAAFLFTFYFLFPRTDDTLNTSGASPANSKTAKHYTRPPLSGSKYNEHQPPKEPALVQQPPQGAGREAMAGATPGAPPVVQQKQKIENLLDLPLIDQLAYQFPYDVKTRFPAYIWQTWKYVPGNQNFEEKFRVPEASWTEKHPEFVHEVITDSVAIHLMRHLFSSVPAVLEAYESLPLPILKADFFRYLILLARGGIYADIDTQALQPATDWISAQFKPSSVGLVIGIEADPDRPDWAQWYSRRIQFCQWTIQSKPGHPVLREIVANITLETLERKRKGTLKKKLDKVVDWTGPAVWTDTIFQYFNNPKFFNIQSASTIDYRNFTGMKEPKKVGDVVVLPITSFSPGVGQMGAGEVDDPMAFVKHDFEGSWKPESERHIGEDKNKKKTN